MKQQADFISVLVGLFMVIGFSIIINCPEKTDAGCTRFGHSCFGAHGKRAEGFEGRSGGDDPLTFLFPNEQIQSQNDDISLPRHRISPYLRQWILNAASRGGDDGRSKEYLPPSPTLLEDTRRK